MPKNFIHRIKDALNTKTKPSISEVCWNRLKNSIPSIEKDTALDIDNKISFEYVAYLNSNADALTQIKAFERFIEDARFKLIYTKNISDKPNFYDLITPILKKSYSATATTIEEIIKGNIKLYHDIELSGNIFSQPTTINNIVTAREKIYQSIKQQAKKNVIDVSDLNYVGYMSYEGMLAYQKTIGLKNYTINSSADEIFKNLLSSGAFLKKEMPDIKIVYSGTSFLEMEWAKAIHAQHQSNNLYTLYNTRQIESIDCSGIPLNYMFSKDKPRHRVGIFDSTQIINSINNELHDNEVIIIKNNAIQEENIESVFKEMAELQKSDNTGMCYTAPIIGCTTDETHYASDHSFGRHFIEEILLSQKEKFTGYATPQHKSEGICYEIGFIANENLKLYNQILTDYIDIKKGTKIVYHKSWRYNQETLAKFSKLSGSKITDSINGVVGLYK